MPKLQRVPEAHVEYAYGIYLLGTKHRLIKALRRRYQPSIHGHKSWGSSFLLMDYLQHHGIRRGARGMEIGCGWGGISTFCAKTFNAKMTAVDLDKEVFPYVDVLADLNSVQVEHLQRDFGKLKTRDLDGQRYLFGSDICFWDSLVDPLSKLVNRAIKSGVERVIITDPGRPTFYEFCDRMAAKHKTKLQEWYAIEPDRFVGEVLEVKPKKP
ncbi:MAG: SAM-dependent methyltransferase [Pseudomonadota bacterium]